MHHSLLLAATLAAAGVTATQYCRCENTEFDHVFPGIQDVCGELNSTNWHSAECNTSGSSCSSCETKNGPSHGKTETAVLETLSSWCHLQEAYDAKSQTYYHGEEVRCYERETSVDLRKRDLEPRYLEFDDPNAAPTNSVILLLTPADGSAATTTKCGLLSSNAAFTAAMAMHIFSPACQEIIVGNDMGTLDGGALCVPTTALQSSQIVTQFNFVCRSNRGTTVDVTPTVPLTPAPRNVRKGKRAAAGKKRISAPAEEENSSLEN
ncbi:hypothetical protein BX600DRAFT_498683 [Xylariales sp. PMI_506]|nr:hypothetical protein BX600DRAFT_498683 [Xylariales sp. PMI_506]